MEISISCANKEKNYKYEIVKIYFSNLLEIIFIEKENQDNLTTGDVYIIEENGIITFDFDPIDYFDHLEENPVSRFKIKCKEINYEVVADYKKDE